MKRNVKSSVKKRVWKRDRFFCQICGLNLKDIYENTYPSDNCGITVDHIISLSDNGTNHITNLRTSCRNCNLKRANKNAYIIYRN